MISRLHSKALAALVGAGCALGAAACGGSSTPALYAPAKTRDCLRQAGLDLQPVTPGIDFVASTALNGALNAKLALNEVTISFGKNEAEATRIAEAYHRFGRRTIPLDKVLQEDKNVVLLWAGEPNPQDADVVHGCLK